MRQQSAYTRRFESACRTPFEAFASIGWAGAAAYLGLTLSEGVLPSAFNRTLLAASLGLALLRGIEARRVLHARSLLSGRRLELKKFSDFREDLKKGELFLGYGFEWTPTHTQKLHELSRTELSRWMLPEFAHFFFGRYGKFQRKEEIGMPFLHGLEAKERPLYRNLKNFEGGLLILGTTQAGKGLTLITLISQAVLRGDVVIFIDPKGSRRMFKGLERACRAAGREAPLIFHPGEADLHTGIRLDPLADFSTGAQLATRITSVIPGRPDIFLQFAWSCIRTFADAMIALGRPITLVDLARCINSGVDEPLCALLEQLKEELDRPKNGHCSRGRAPGGSKSSGALAGISRRDAKDNGSSEADTLNSSESEDNWKAKARSFMAGKERRTDAEDRLYLLISWYENLLPKEEHSLVIDECLKIFHHSKEHYAKITATLMPIFSLLTSGALEKSFSPNTADVTDHRPVHTVKSIIEGQRVLYLNLDSLSDSTVASAAGALILAELAYIAGERYNRGKTDRRIMLFVDEASNVINQPLIEILNKGAEGGIYSTVAMQTIADLAHRLGSQDAARMVLGNCNNLIALRCKDRPTQDFVTETFGKTYVHQVDTTLSTHADAQGGLPSFEGGASHRRSASREEIIPSEYLGKLPNGQFFASVAGGHLFKGRVPVLLDDEAPGTPSSEKVRA